MRLRDKDNKAIENAIDKIQEARDVLYKVPAVGVEGYEQKKYDDIANRTHRLDNLLRDLQSELQDLADPEID